MSRSHGTRSCYNGGCRCEACKAASRDYNNQRRQEAYARRIVDIDLRDVARVPAAMHGRLSTYTNLGCRCEKCTEASTTYARSYSPAYRAGVRRRSA